MYNSNQNNIDFYDNMKFVEKHIGGNQTDSIDSFNNQSNLVTNSTTNYHRILDYNNKIERDKNKTDNYVEKIDNEQRTTVYRINNYPTYVDDINVSNPVIYPKEYDMYFEYLDKKNINPINTQVVKTKNYINIDSSNRNTNTNIDVNHYINIIDYSLEFKNQQNMFKIYMQDADKNFKQNDFIILRGFSNYSIYYENLNFFFTNGSTIVILDIKGNFNEKIPYYDVFIRLNGITNPNDENSLYWKNIQLSLLNDLHKIFIVDTLNDGRIGINLPIAFYSDNDIDKILISNCTVTFLSLGNYPINMINSNTPISSNSLNNYLIVSEVTNNYLKLILSNTLSLNKNINLDGYWSGDFFRTGKNIQIGRIDGFIQGYSNPNNFVVNLDRNYNNVCSIKMISSEIPNSQKNITIIENNQKSNITELNISYIQQKNNKLYWQNILDYGIYSIDLEPGYYSYEQLAESIELAVSKVKRNIIFNNSSIYPYNLINVTFKTDTNISSFKMFNIYILPNCLDGLTELNLPNTNGFIIRINHPNHNLVQGDRIFIENSIDYYIIKSNYINDIKGHIITNIINNNFYEITLECINPIDSVFDTKGGYEIKIKSYACFRLFFNFLDTFGSLIGFSLVGLPNSITNFATNENNYTINNIESYYFDIRKILIINNTISPYDITVGFSKQITPYILLLAEGLNNNYNPNGPSYFYKILLNGQPNSYLFNTFIQTPIYFNPPIKNLNNLKFTFIYPNGGLVNFGNLNVSFCLEITTLSNLPENTNISTYMSRI